MQIGRISKIPETVRIMPSRIQNFIIIVKSSFALFSLPSPRVFATRAVPPVPIINPVPPRIMMNG